MDFGGKVFGDYLRVPKIQKGKAAAGSESSRKNESVGSVQAGAVSLRPNTRAETSNEYYAAVAAARRLGVGVSSPSQRTLTILETPGSCMVTP